MICSLAPRAPLHLSRGGVVGYQSLQARDRVKLGQPVRGAPFWGVPVMEFSRAARDGLPRRRLSSAPVLLGFGSDYRKGGLKLKEPPASRLAASFARPHQIYRAA